MHDASDVLPGVQADVGRHAGEKDVPGAIPEGHGHGLPLEVADGADRVGREEFEAADVDPARMTIGSPASSHEERPAEVPIEIRVAGGEGRLDIDRAPLSDILHLGEPFARRSSSATYWGARQMLGIWTA